LKSGSLNLLEPSGPVKACNGIALALSFNVLVLNILQHVLAWGPLVEMSEAMGYAMAEAGWDLMHKQRPTIDNVND
jgi:hypothetical protein